MTKFGVDDDGGIITEVSRDKIAPRFRPAIDQVLASLVRALSTRLEAIYLYGSVVTGQATVRQSDLDVILVFREQPDDEARQRVSSLERGLTEHHALTFRDVGLGVTWVDDVCSEKEKYGGMCFLKHLCVCVHGRDLTEDVESFKPSREVARGFNGDIGQSLSAARSKLQASGSEAETVKLARSVARKIVRTGFSLVMPRARCWTTDLHTACATFGGYYPERRAEMEALLPWATHGCRDKQAVLACMDTFGAWLVNEFERELSSA